ncbi:MAG: ABC-type Fe3+/spermidine/putrescine transport system ATPase subunit [Polyangiales bacterium]|jgi:ABC-type Fe3+/spermidine/putrescine transport system ATPase subunit
MTWSAKITLALGELSLNVAFGGENEVAALIGPNGSGKTSLLRALAGLTDAAGEFTVEGADLLSPSVDVAPEARGVGYVPQGFGLFPHLNVVDNVAFGLSAIARSERRPKARAALAELGCERLAPRRCDSLSGGEKQRVALARALVTQPRILLLDEPLAPLDVGVRRRVREHLAEQLRARPIPTLLVTHDVRDLPQLVEYVFVLEDGRIVQRGTLEELRDAPATEFVAEFVAAPS